MAIDYALLIAIVIIPLAYYRIKNKPKWLKDINEEMLRREAEAWESFKQLEAEGLNQTN